MFENLTQRLQAAFANLRGKGKLTEQDVDSALRLVRMALLEADVNYKVVKDFIASVRVRAVGQEVMTSLKPAHQVIKIVREELTSLMGGSRAHLSLGGQMPAAVLMVGLQGSGKTTSAAKLARHLVSTGRSPLLVAADIYRPAAIEQLKVLGEQIKVPVFTMGDKTDPVVIAKAALEQARRQGRDIVLIDTAGRLQIDEAMMQELERIKAEVKPAEILLVVDAMTGQEAVNIAARFHERLQITGVIMTKLDGDARGGAALSVRAVTGQPIKYIATGEKLDALEPFHPERMATRLLGMGDILTLIEKAESQFDKEQAEKLAGKLLTNQFTLEDFLQQLRQLRKMGPLDQLLGMIPGMAKMADLGQMTPDEKELGKIEAIICSMTRAERQDPAIIDAGRRRRIAAGSGTTVQDVNRLLKQFNEAKAMMKRFGNLQKDSRRRLSGRLFR